MQFVLQGFTQEEGFRVFRFEGIAADHARSAFVVQAEVALLQRYGIPLQDLPLLCRTVLERDAEASARSRFTLDEAQMAALASERRAAREESARRRKAPRRSPNTMLGASWRTPPR
ncbi:MAG: hypothetical protein MUC42_14140 [Bryobacter sp.]|jgi:hypothetical protein|nr:hypothetical protein [Bryobacter sp.]